MKKVEVFAFVFPRIADNPSEGRRGRSAAAAAAGGVACNARKSNGPRPTAAQHYKVASTVCKLPSLRVAQSQVDAKWTGSETSASGVGTRGGS